MINQKTHRHRTAAFSLIELLSVIAVTLTLLAVCVPGISGTIGGLKVTNAAQVVVEEIQTARATALARNTPVEIWFLKEGNRYQAVRSSLININNTSSWLGRTRRLPEGVAFASAQKYSNVIGAQTAAAAPESPAGTQGVRLRVYPSGRLELVEASSSTPVGPNQPLFVTLTPYASFDVNSEGDLPKTFATVQINPINSRITTHRL